MFKINRMDKVTAAEKTFESVKRRCRMSQMKIYFQGTDERDREYEVYMD